MTAASIFRSFPTANDVFKNRYRVSVRVSLGLALAVHALAFLLIPALSVRPFRLQPPDRPPEVVDIPDESPLPAFFTEETMPARPGFTPMDPLEPVPEEGPAELPPPSFEPAPGPPRSGPAPGRFIPYDSPPVLAEFVKPEYPRLARDAGMGGLVVVRVLVDERGGVTEAAVVSSEAPPGLEESALRAARACRFEPARQGHVPVPAWVSIPFSFSLR